jgi:hypothetical protein
MYLALLTTTTMLEQINTLPCPQIKLATINRDRQAGMGKNPTHVRTRNRPDLLKYARAKVGYAELIYP